MEIEELRGTYGEKGIDYARDIKKTGCNALWYHGFRESGFEACERYNLKPCVEFRTFRADYDRRPGLVPLDVQGNPLRRGTHFQGICPSQRDFIDERLAELADGMARFSPHGVWLDYLTGGGWFESARPDLQENCFCPSCVEAFEAFSGIDCDSPSVILEQHRADWTDFHCRRIARLGSEFARIIKAADSQCLVGVYMCPWTPEEYGGALRTVFGQDYALLADFTDVFTPLIYAEKSGRPAAWARDFIKEAGRFVPPEKPVIPILDALDFPGCLEALVKVKGLSRGFQMFAGGELFSRRESRLEFARLMETWLAD